MNSSRIRCLGSTSRRITASILMLLLLATSVQAESPSSLYKKGQDLEARQDYEAAYTAYQQAWSQKPKDVKYRSAAMRTRFLAGQAHVHRGQQLRDAGKLQDALAEFQKAAAIDPSSFIAAQEIQRTQTMIESAKSAAAAGKVAPPRSFIERKLEKAAAEPVELEPLSTQPITLKMTEDSKLIFQTVGNLAGINVLFDPDYTSRKIHVELNGVTLAEALRMIALESKTFWRPVTRNAIFIASDTPAKRKELEENIIKTFYLTNLSQTTELQDVVNTLRTLLEVSKVIPVPSLGAIAVRGTPDQIALADKLIKDLDKGHPEVVVDVAIMQVSRDKLRDIGTNLPTSATVYPLSNVVASTTTTPPTSTTTTSVGNAPGQINFGHVNGTSFAVNIPSATANFLFSDGNTKVIQNPQIRVADGQKATLKIGDRVPVATGSFQAGVAAGGISPLVNTQFQYLDVGVNIDITPYVHGDRSVTLKISMEISSVTGSVNIGGISQPIIGQRRLDHEIRLREGEVNLLGGILEDTDIKSVSGYPGLSNIPILKYLFSDQHTERQQNEIVFVLTPHIVRAPEVSESNLRALDVGTGANIELRDSDAAPPAQAARPTASPNAPSPVATPAASQPVQRQTAPAAQPQTVVNLRPPAQPVAVPAQGPTVASSAVAAQVTPSAAAALPVSRPMQPQTTPAAAQQQPVVNVHSPAPAAVAPAEIQQPATPAAMTPAAATPAAVNPAAATAQAATPQAAVPQVAQQPSVRPESVWISFDPSQLTATVGQTFTVNMVVSNAQNLSLAPVQLQYDPARLQVTNVSNGGFLGQGQAVVAVAQRDDPATGTIRITAMRPPESGGASGTGSLLAITFLAKAEGQATLSITRAGLRNSLDQPVASTGTQAMVEIKQPTSVQAAQQTKP